MDQNKLFVSGDYLSLIDKVNAFLANPDVHYKSHSMWPGHDPKTHQMRCFYLLVYQDHRYQLDIGHLKIQFANHISKYLMITVIRRLMHDIGATARAKEVWRKRSVKHWSPTSQPYHRPVRQRWNRNKQAHHVKTWRQKPFAPRQRPQIQFQDGVFRRNGNRF